MHPREQTIVALASGRLPCAIAVVRVSGSQAGPALSALSGRLPAPRRASRALLRASDGTPIDDAVVLWFPGPASATGEDVAEFQVHGGRAVVQALLAALLQIGGLRLAERGEFTRRAFENGKLDLTEAEGLDDLIHADTERQRRHALRQLQGQLGARAQQWRRQIIEAAALIEAGIDFPDEGDVPAELLGPAQQKIARLRDDIKNVLASQGRSERLRDGLVVAIAGPPNVGKSTLMNQLARREIAIVSPHAGTTRDVIEVQLDLDGYPVTVIDTAGIRETEDPVEQEGVRRARARAAEADLVLWLWVEGSALPEGGEGPVWTVRNKVDLDNAAAAISDGGPEAVRARFAISARDGDGVADLVQALVGFAAEFFGSTDHGLISRARHREMLQVTVDRLTDSLEAVQDGEELAAEHLRSATVALGRLLGTIDVEDILGVLFSEFCIGK